MTQVELAVTTVPHCFTTTFVVGVTVPATMSDCFLCWILSEFHWEVTEWKGGWGKCCTTSSFPTVVVSNKITCYLKPELFVWFLLCYTGVVGVEDVNIGKYNFEEEPKDIPVEFSTFGAHVIILPQLLISVYTSRVAIVQLHCCWTRDITSAPIMLSSLYSRLFLR